MNITKTCVSILLSMCNSSVLPAQQGWDPRQFDDPSVIRTPLPGTELLTLDGDLAATLIAGVDRFLLREIDRSIELRAARWNRDFSSVAAYNQSIDPNRRRLAHITGVRDPRMSFEGLEYVATTVQPALVGQGVGYSIFAIRWPAFGDVYGEGLMLVPDGNAPVADVIAVPDADVLPEMIAGLKPGVPAASQYGRRLAESGCRVFIPCLVDRQLEHYGPRRGFQLTHREYCYRPAFELGRHIIGYEIQKILALVDWLKRNGGNTPVGVLGWGEGGLLALYAAALDTRIDAAGVSGYFDVRQRVWEEPIDRNVFGLLEMFGDAEIGSLIAPRPLILEAAKGPEVVVAPGNGGGPGRLTTPKLVDVRSEIARAKALVAGLPQPWEPHLIVSGNGGGPFGTDAWLQAFLHGLTPGATLPQPGATPESRLARFDAAARQQRQIQAIDRHTQELLQESALVRNRFWNNLNTATPDSFAASVEWYRDYFYEEVIGKFPDPLLPPNVRSRKAWTSEKWEGYEVVLDVFPDVMACGILLLPKDLSAGERRPVVVCQHGLDGEPRNLFLGDNRAYNDFAAKLAERGFITFLPQNLYVGPFGDTFRTLQRKGNPIKKTLFSVITPQHQQICDWLASLPFVDPNRIAFYGLSYGGKTAMRVPPLVNRYCLSICSGDFNEWIWKNASTSSFGINRYSYVAVHEYEIFEFDLGNTFNYAEMAALIAPRPFMVERGHFDTVAPDEMVAYEFAKVRRLYNALLKIPERLDIEWFPGPHSIHGVGTFDFLHKHLQWPKPE